MIKKIIPFSNGTEFMIWESNNCDQCKRVKCYAKLQLQKGCITGVITLKQANWIGYDNKRLNSKCNYFNVPNKGAYKNDKIVDKFQIDMF